MEIHSFCNLLPNMTEEDFSSLKEDIKQNGLIEPIVLYQGKILDGKHRYRVCVEIGIEPIFTEFEGDELSALQFVISKNIKRRHLTESQKAALAVEILPEIEKLTRKKQIEAGYLGKDFGLLGGRGIKKGSEEYEEKKKPLMAILPEGVFNKNNDNKTARQMAAQIVGVGERYIQTAKKIAQKSPELIEKVKKGVITLPDAEKIAKLENSEFIDKVIQKLESGEIDRVKDAIVEVKKEKLNNNRIIFDSEDYALNNNIRLIHGDFREIDIEENSIDLIITDPPYPGEYLPLWRELGIFAKRVLKPSGFLIAYSGELYLPQVIYYLQENLIYYWIFSLIHTGGSQIVSARNIMCGWKPVLIFQKEPFKKLDNPIKDVIYGAGRQKDYHEWQQALEEIIPLIEQFSTPGDTVLDPFAGSGTTLLAALTVNRKVIGIEKEEECIGIIKSRLTDIMVQI